MKCMERKTCQNNSSATAQQLLLHLNKNHELDLVQSVPAKEKYSH